MDDPTLLDRAHAEMQANPDDDAKRLRFYEHLVGCELFLLLTEEARADAISPEVFDVADGRFVLCFDREERLSQFVGQSAPFAALSGRAIVQMLVGQGVGLALNPDVAPSSYLLSDDALVWLNNTVSQEPETLDVHLQKLVPPTNLPEDLLRSLDVKLAAARGLAEAAYLVGTVQGTGAPGHLLGFVGTRAGAEDALARLVGEALSFSDVAAGMLDVGFFSPDDPVVERLVSAGLRFDLPKIEPTKRHAPTAPGSDPDRPPKLR